MGYDIKQILNTAHSFNLAAERCLEERHVTDGKFQMLVTPAIVNMAFGTELFLKAIISLETGNNERGHKLSVLFAQLSSKSQTSLRASFSMTDIAFDQKLTEISNVFEDRRYIFECQSSNVDLAFLKRFIEAARHIAESLTR